MEQLWLSTLLELKTLISSFTPQSDKNEPTDQGPHEYWRRRYARAVERLQQAGIKTTASGVEKYISLRAEWDQYITRLAPQFAYDMDEIDTALAKVK